MLININFADDKYFINLKISPIIKHCWILKGPSLPPPNQKKMSEISMPTRTGYFFWKWIQQIPNFTIELTALWTKICQILTSDNHNLLRLPRTWNLRPFFARHMVGFARQSSPFQSVIRRGDTQVGSRIGSNLHVIFFVFFCIYYYYFLFSLKILFLIDFNNKVVCSRVDP